MADAMRRRVAAAAASALLLAGAHAAVTRFETEGEGELITVSASADLQVAPGTVWSVISDYEHLADFIPDMHSSRVIRRDGDSVLIEQTGEFGFLFFRQPVEVRLSVQESPPRQIVAHAVGGNLKMLEGRYAVESLPGGEVRLSYAGRLEPQFQLPAFVGRMVVRNTMARQFDALVQEIVRRDRARRQAASGK